MGLVARVYRGAHGDANEGERRGGGVAQENVPTHGSMKV